MVNRSPPTPLSVWDEYIQRIEADSAEVQNNPAPVQSGQMGVRSVRPDGPSEDMSLKWSELNERAPSTSAAISAALAKKRNP